MLDDERPGSSGSWGSQRVALPTQSDGSIRVLGPAAHARVLRREAVARTRPNRARLVIAALALLVGGLTIWYSEKSSGEHTPSVHR
jgi:hypothetical protein